MRRGTLTMTLMVAGIAALSHALGLYAGERAAEVKSLIRQIDGDSRAIQVLEAELTYLRRPERLQALSADNLSLRPPSPEQIIPDVALLPDLTPEPNQVAVKLKPRRGGKEAPL